MPRIVKVQFHTAGKIYDFNAGTMEMKTGDRVIVETERGKSIASVVVPPREFAADQLPEGLKSVIRMAQSEDLALAARTAAREQETFSFCLAKIQERGMQMKLVKVEYLYDGSKAIFYFTADGRVDFRELVKDLAHQFHTRIEMRQIGVRDEAKLVGGIGICGRELCCCSFLRDFAPVSVKMAKEQNLALNPAKISGQCGRLLCCLGYEFDTYSALRQGLPKCGKMVRCGQVEGEVLKQNIFEETVTIRTTDDRVVEVRKEDIRAEDVFEKVRKPPREQAAQGRSEPAEAPAAPGGRDRRRERRPPPRDRDKRPEGRKHEERKREEKVPEPRPEPPKPS